MDGLADDHVGLARIGEHADTSERDEGGVGDDREDRDAAQLLQAKSDQLSRGMAVSLAERAEAGPITRLRPPRLDPSEFAEATAKQGQKPDPLRVEDYTWDVNSRELSGYWGLRRGFVVIRYQDR